MADDDDAGEHLKAELLEMRRLLDIAFYSEPERRGAEVERKRLDMALSVVGGFLNRTLGPKYGDPFFRTASHFRDLNRGVTPSVMDAPHIGGAQDPSWTWQERAFAAGAVEALHASGHSLRAAAEQVARDYPRFDGQVVNATTILGWHKKLKAGKVKSRQGECLFEMVREEISKVPLDGRREAVLCRYADKLLKQLRNLGDN
jgi:hypothetical protein